MGEDVVAAAEKNRERVRDVCDVKGRKMDRVLGVRNLLVSLE